MAQISMEMDVSAETIAEWLDLTDRQVRSLVAEGDLPKASRGRYPLRECIQDYVELLRRRAYGGGSSGGYAHHRSRLARAGADAAELEARRIAGELILVREVEAVWPALISASKQPFAGMGARVVPRLKGLGDRERKAILDREIDAAFDALTGARPGASAAGIGRAAHRESF